MKREYRIGEKIQVTCNRGTPTEKLVTLQVCKGDSCSGCVYVTFERGPLGQFDYGCKLRSNGFCKHYLRTGDNNINYRKLINRD